MKSRSVYLFSLVCAAAMAAGFSLSAFANPFGGCETCHLNCLDGFSQRMQSGRFTPAQCNDSYYNCIFYDCGNCRVP